jgi:hypothetical protein
MFRGQHRSFLTTFIGILLGLMFIFIGPCSSRMAADDVTFLRTWSEHLPRFFSPSTVTQEDLRRDHKEAEVELRRRLEALNDRIAFKLPKELQIPANSLYPIMEYMKIRERYVDKIRARLGDAPATDIPFPREPTSSMTLEKIEENLVKIHLLDMLLNTFQGFSFQEIRISEARPNRNQRVGCDLIDRATEYVLNFEFVSSLEETLRWIDRLRNEKGFFYVRSIEMRPAQNVPNGIEVNAGLVAVSLEAKDNLFFSPVRLDR